MKSFYLQPYSSLARLKTEFQKYGKLILAVDFDDTILDSVTSTPNEDICKLLRRWVPYAEIIIWTCRTFEDYSFIMETCAANGFTPNKINEPSDRVDFGSRKIYANAILDDRAGLNSVYKDLNELINQIENNEILL